MYGLCLWPETVDAPLIFCGGFCTPALRTGLIHFAPSELFNLSDKQNFDPSSHAWQHPIAIGLKSCGRLYTIFRFPVHVWFVPVAGNGGCTVNLLWGILYPGFVPGFYISLLQSFSI
jgi:hypothetical protein